MTDIVVYGATGFVGKLIAGYLARNAPAITVAIAGRNQAKLEHVRADLGADVPIITAAISDAAALRDMAEQAGVVISAVGPYRKHGLPLVKACAETGTDYADLTGEPFFIRESVEQFDKTAADSGARIVHTCGFDSIPSDLGVFLLNETVKADGAGDLEDTTMVVTSMKGGVSGGTIASMLHFLEEVESDPALKAIAEDPYSLSPDRAAEPDLGDESDLTRPRYDKVAEQWVAPFVMEAVNARVVRRSNALFGWAYGRNFRYHEAMAGGAGAGGRAKATALAAGLGTLQAGLRFGPTRKLATRVLPDQGEGPSEKMRRTGYFNIDIHSRTSTGARYVSHVAGQGDPGYAATAVMIGEAARCLLENKAGRAGVLTPATAMGSALVERLRDAGHAYEVKRTG